jgi:16S rRNA G966 N2-methylase RsmD
MDISAFYKLVSDKGYYSTAARLQFYMENQLFKDVDFADKSLIDIGGGNGLFGFYAACKGAKHVVVMEPEFDGSSSGMIREFNELKKLLGGLDNIEHTTKVLEEYDRDSHSFDYILMHNSVNHINEEACITLTREKESDDIYQSFLLKLREICHDGTELIICDAARNNFWSDMGMSNPFTPQIEWQKHQNPKVWSRVFEKAGFETANISWTSPNQLGKLGNLFFGNRIGAYFTISHFRMVLKFLSSEKR